MKIILVRHGECSTGKKYTGSGSDVPLNFKGIHQIKNLIKELLLEINNNSSTLYSSSLIRAKQSAGILKESLNFNKYIIDKRINEIDFGDFEGLTYNEIMNSYYDIATKWYEDPSSITPPNAESFKDFYLRVEQFWSEIKLSNKDCVVIVSHGGVIQLLSTFILNDLVENRWEYDLSRGGFKTFIYNTN